MHIPKTGVTAVGSALAGLGINRQGHSFQLTHMRHGDRALVIVRDPLRRFVSAYDWLVDHDETFAFPTADSLALDMEGAWLAQPRELELFKPLTWWLFDAATVLSKASWIAHTETLDEDYARLGIGAPLPLHGAPARNEGTHHSTLSPAAADALREWYAEDYELLEALP